MNSFFHALVVMNALFASCSWCLARGTFLSSSAVVVTSVAWVLLNGPIEGRVLVVLTPTNGITESDLLSVIGIGIALVGYVRAAARRRAAQPLSTTTA
jgi:FtsH-binding integral membrane protein